MKRFFFLILLFFSLIIYSKHLLSEIIKSIKINGNQRIDNETILSYVKITPNKDIHIMDLNIAFKDLFATDLFSEIKFEISNNVLLIDVKENPIINRIALEGNKRIKDEDVFPEINLKPRDIFTLNKVKNNL